MAKRLVNHFGSIDTLANASHEELLAVEDIGEKIVESIQAYFSSSQNHQMIQALKEFGLTMELKKTAQLSHQLEGKTIVVSGVFERISRNDLKQLIEDHGGKVGSSISSKTSFVVAGNSMGPAKKQKAENLGIPLISESDFLNML